MTKHDQKTCLDRADKAQVEHLKFRLRFTDRSGVSRRVRGIPYRISNLLLSAGYARALANQEIQLRPGLFAEIDKTMNTIRLFAEKVGISRMRVIEPMLQLRLNCSTWNRMAKQSGKAQVDQYDHRLIAGLALAPSDKVPLQPAVISS